MKYKAVIFDLFGTLVDIFSRDKYDNSLLEMISILKLPWAEFREIWMKTASQRAVGTFKTLEANLEYICNKLDLAYTEKQIENASRIRHDFVVQALAPRKDAIEVISTLKSNGHKIGLVSNCSPEPPVVWKDTPFAPYFDVTVFSSTAGLRKPDPRIYQMAIEKLGVKAKDCLYIGDGDSNELTGALKIGMKPVLIRNTHENHENTVRSGFEGDAWQGTVITSLKEVLNLLK